MARKMDIQSIPNHKFQFTRNWFRNRNKNTFLEFVLPYWKDREANVLEIGVFEGMCMVWMLQYLHPSNQYWGIDPWLETAKLDDEVMEQVRLRAYHNTSPYGARCKLYRANSNEALRRAGRRHGFYGIKKETLDLCIIDGDHTELAVLADARQCLPLVKPGGHILFDDVEAQIKKRHQVKDGLRMFLDESGDAVKSIWKHHYMECFEKL